MINAQKVTLYSTIVQTPGNIVSDMDGEKVMLSIEKGKYYNLGVLGGVIWELIESPITGDELVKQLLEEYDVDQKECEEEVLSFLNHLKDEELITVS